MVSSKRNIGEPLFPYQTHPITQEDEARKEEYRKRLADYLKDPKFRQADGFPIGTDEAILALSDPPYYTACPNPFLPEILEEWQEERRKIREELGLPLDDARYRREPFAADVSEGKNDPIYNAHSYHTKVPHKAIMRYVLHYTDPGDIVFDGFCGTGMTGVAAQLCGDKTAVEALGYLVGCDGAIVDEMGKPISSLGVRKAILNDLSPAASFIAYNYNTQFNTQYFYKEAIKIINDIQNEFGWMYETHHSTNVKGVVNYIIWSDVFTCPHCGFEMIYWDVAVDMKTKELKNGWSCPHCLTNLSKNPSRLNRELKAQHAFETKYDIFIGETIKHVKHVPVLINYSVGKNRYEKKPDDDDLSIIHKINESQLNLEIPNVPMMFKGGKWGDTWRAGVHAGLTHVHHFYTTRNLYVLAALIKKISGNNNIRFRSALAFCFSSAIRYQSRLAKVGMTYFFSKGGGVVNAGISGTLFVPSFSAENNVLKTMSTRIPKLVKVFDKTRLSDENVITSSASSSSTTVASDSIDYIFVDPPFGGNLMYSELNFLSEAWFKVFTNNLSEAIISPSQHKKLFDYQEAIQKCFEEFYRILKPSRWITIEFHNSQNSVWNAIQEALFISGFVVADVRTLDKKQGSFKQVNTTNAVKQDLIISAYKSSRDFENKFNAEAGTEHSAWRFVHQHLNQLPLPNIVNFHLELQIERMPYLLYDRLIAFHLVRGLTIPLSSSEFYIGLGNRFLMRDGMFFTSSQAAEYDKLRLKAEKVEQLTIFIVNEQNGIQWLQHALNPVLGGKPSTYSDIMPNFLKFLHKEKHEKMPELMTLLEQNFLLDAEGRWYMPDPDRQADMEAIRYRALIHEFTDYLKSKGKLKVFRSEAVRAGFSKAWKERDYKTIVQVAERLPEAVLQEDPKLKMYYDNAIGRAERQPHQEPLL
jgi:DNA modification methylase/predicted RNA-binding Zn-ribbon protein involved in translation (DUF1610 family)